MKVRIRFNDKINKYVIQKKQWLRWSVVKYAITRKNPKWWQSVYYLKPCIFRTREEANKFLNKNRIMINNYGETVSVEEKN